MKTLLSRSRINVHVAALTLLIEAIVSIPHIEAQNRASGNSNANRKIILEVSNVHFTMGKKIPSLYLRVFSDGMAECRTEQYTGHEKEVTKTSTLSSEAFDKLKAVINDPGMSNVKKRYELMHWVVDAWMEWDITLQHGSSAQRIRVASFSPSSAREKNQPYPEALVALGCSILKARRDVYGDEGAHNVDCNELR